MGRSCELAPGINLQSPLLSARTIRALSRFLIYRVYQVVSNSSLVFQDKPGNSGKPSYREEISHVIEYRDLIGWWAEERSLIG